MKKKTTLLFLLFSVLFIISSCTQSNEFMSYDSTEYINLYDYSQIVIEEDYLSIDDTDVKAIIETELSVNEAYIEICDKEYVEQDNIALLSIDGVPEFYFVGSEAYGTQLEKILLNTKKGDILHTDSTLFSSSNVKLLGIYRPATYEDESFILEYYNCNSVEELKTYITNRAREEIIFNHLFDIIYEKSSLIAFPDEIKTLMDNDTQTFKEEILNEYASIDDYYKEIGITNDEFTETIQSGYYEMMLYKAILDNENTTIDIDDINNFAIENNYTNDYSSYDIYKELAYEMVREILVNNATISNN